jgi:hypothetical protein
MIAHEDVSSNQQKMVGRWDTDRMVGCYISSLPVEAMKSLAGFPPHKGNCFLSRAAVVPPKDLQVLVFLISLARPPPYQSIRSAGIYQLLPMFGDSIA